MPPEENGRATAAATIVAWRMMLVLGAGSAVADECSALLDVEYRRLAKEVTVRLCDAYQGKVLLIVNTASKCGFTPQYEGLQELHKELGQKGLVIIGFPCNQFGGQEPGSQDVIANFCQKNYGVDFLMAEKVDVKGSSGIIQISII